MRRAESTGECAYLHPLRSRTSRPLRHNPDDLAESGLRARSELGCLSSRFVAFAPGQVHHRYAPAIAQPLVCDIADERATTAHHGFPGFKQIPRICSVRAHCTSHEPGRSLFVNDLGKLRTPEPDRCAV